jgi:hypothetical protein
VASPSSVVSEIVISLGLASMRRTQAVINSVSSVGASWAHRRTARSHEERPHPP